MRTLLLFFFNTEQMLSIYFNFNIPPISFPFVPYVALWDPESTQFQCYLGPSPRDWRTLIHFNVVLTVFHIDHISQGLCKTARTTFWWIIVLQLRGEGLEKAHNYGTDLGRIFRTFSPQLENNSTFKFCSVMFLADFWHAFHRISQLGQFGLCSIYL